MTDGHDNSLNGKFDQKYSEDHIDLKLKRHQNQPDVDNTRSKSVDIIKESLHPSFC